MPKPRAVLDSSVVVSGIGWRGGDARAVLKLLAAGGFESWRTPWITAEWTDAVQRVAEAERRWRNPNWTNWLERLKTVPKFSTDIPIRKTVKRDPKDDPVIMAAVAVRAAFIVTSDSDLLDLRKPHDVSCVTPHAHLSAILRQQ
ncbi:MAG: putative toxin-antitoxin system toxin component, PIN family [Limisphaerales bacterium]